MANIEHLPVEI